MNDNLNTFVEEETESGEFEREGEVIETVEFNLTAPKAGTVITCKDPEGYDQSPIPEIVSASPNYDIEKVTVNGIERPAIYWRAYNTLVYYDDVCVEPNETYTVFGKVKAAPGYIFNDPVELIINGEEVSSEEVEDYSLEGDSFTFYFDIKATGK